jgi:hypothetical protein
MTQRDRPTLPNCRTRGSARRWRCQLHAKIRPTSEPCIAGAIAVASAALGAILTGGRRSAAVRRCIRIGPAVASEHEQSATHECWRYKAEFECESHVTIPAGRVVTSQSARVYPRAAVGATNSIEESSMRLRYAGTGHLTKVRSDALAASRRCLMDCVSVRRAFAG